MERCSTDVGLEIFFGAVFFMAKLLKEILIYFRHFRRNMWHIAQTWSDVWSLRSLYNCDSVSKANDLSCGSGRLKIYEPKGWLSSALRSRNTRCVE